MRKHIYSDSKWKVEALAEAADDYTDIELISWENVINGEGMRGRRRVGAITGRSNEALKALLKQMLEALEAGIPFRDECFSPYFDPQAE